MNKTEILDELALISNLSVCLLSIHVMLIIPCLYLSVYIYIYIYMYIFFLPPPPL